MFYLSRVYGTCGITEPVILDLLRAPSMERLKKIDQGGYLEPYFPGTSQSRYEHSVGVYLLLRRYGAPLEEQVAGLIHDVSHSAFSHCIDYVFSSGSGAEQGHQDAVFDPFVRHSEIPSILQSHHLDPEYILDDGHFPLKENPLPDLCADRIDYALLAACVYGEIKSAEEILSNLSAEKGDWVFDGVQRALDFAQLFQRLNAKYWSGFTSAIMFRSVGDYLRCALSKKYIDSADLYTTDEMVLDKIKPHLEADPEIRHFFERMDGHVKAHDDPSDFDGVVTCKSRVVDPLCLHDGMKRRLSELMPSWKETVERESRPKTYHVKFE